MDIRHALAAGGVPVYVFFFAYVWVLWLLKTLAARRYRPYRDPAGLTDELTTSVIIPVYNERLPLFRRVLASVTENGPTEVVVVVDGGTRRLVELAREYAETVIPIPKSGKRIAIATGAAAVMDADVIVVVDSDSIWAPGMLSELVKPFADPRVGGVTTKQRIIDPRRNAVRRLSDWLEDLRYSLTVPAQSVFGQVGCLAGRTVAYRRQAFQPAVEALVRQRVFGVPMGVGDDRVLTKEIMRRRWRTVFQSTAVVATDAPNTWRAFWRQQLRWGRSSQRETLLSARWLWRRPVAALIFLSDILTPFMVFALYVTALFDVVTPDPSYLPQLPLELTLLAAFAGMVTSIGLRQIPHLRRTPGDWPWLPLFVLQLTFLMVPARLVAFAPMFQNDWGTRQPPPRTRRPAAASVEVV